MPDNRSSFLITHNIICTTRVQCKSTHSDLPAFRYLTPSVTLHHTLVRSLARASFALAPSHISFSCYATTLALARSPAARYAVSNTLTCFHLQSRFVCSRSLLRATKGTGCRAAAAREGGYTFEFEEAHFPSAFLGNKSQLLFKFTPRLI